MKTTSPQRHRRGYISLLLVVSTATILSLLMIYAYRRAVDAEAFQSQIQMRVDYSEKEDAILRSIVSIVPNRAIRAMQQDSNLNTSKSDPLRWQDIFTESLVLANARTSVSQNLATSLNITNLVTGNAGDSTLNDPTKIFAAIPSETGYVSAGINRSLGAGYPVPLTSSDTTTSNRDAVYPIISANKVYGTLAQGGVGLPVGTYPNFNLVKYPQINFGYGTPGQDFVAKRNWWAFSVDVGGYDSDKTYLARVKRNFVLSIYEIPSQLPISAASYMSLGKYTSGAAWQNVTINGPMFVGKAAVDSNTAVGALAARRGVTLGTGATVGGQSFTGSPFAPGVRETYQVTQGAFFPVSLASESGKAAFVPITRGPEFFDRFSNTDETSVLSTTTWNNYSVGAMQCAMRLDVTAVTSATNSTPTMLRFGYLTTAGARATMNIPLTTAVQTTLPAGYVKVCDENQSYTFASAVDVAYGTAGGFTFRSGLSGTIAFNNTTFGDPLVGTVKAGYWRPRSPFETKILPSGAVCVAVYPQRIPPMLATVSGAAAVTVNNSLVVNVDYTTTGLNNSAKKPSIPCTSTDYGLIMQECANLSPFTKGFSLVTNLRLFIGSDFNTTTITPPTGYTPPSGTYYPPCSLFAPEKRYGVEIDPYGVSFNGQVGSLASDTATNPVRPLDSKNLSGNAIDASRIKVNLKQITHPAELPPITMMNWLILLEERKKDFY